MSLRTQIARKLVDDRPRGDGDGGEDSGVDGEGDGGEEG